MVWWLVAGFLGLMLLHHWGVIGVPLAIRAANPQTVPSGLDVNLVTGGFVPHHEDPNPQGGLTNQKSGWHLVSTVAAPAPPPPPPTIGLKQ